MKKKYTNPFLKNRYSAVSQTLNAYQTAINEAAIVSITDLSGKIIYVNNKFIEISKYSADELIGQTHRIINSGYHPGEFFKELWQTISKGKPWRDEIKNKTKDGSFYWVDTVITPVFDKQGNIFQYLSIRNLITVQKENQEKLIRIQHEMGKREQQLKDAQRVAKTGSWYFNVPDKQLEWSEETYHIFELPVGKSINYQIFLEKVHPEDREMVDNAWRAALKNGRYDIRHRIVNYGGEKWVRESAQFGFDKSTNLKSVLGTVQDITEKKKIEESLIESEKLYKTLFNNSPFVIGILDKETLQFLEINETAIKLYGYTREEFLKLTAYDLRLPEDHQKVTSQLSNGEYAQDESIRLHKKRNGEVIRVEPSIVEMNYKNKPAYLINIEDKTERLKIEEELNLTKRTRQKEILEAQENSRSEIGRELHDNINQLLAAARLYFSLVPTSNETDKQRMDTGMNIISSVNEEIRKLSASLASPNFYHNTLKESIENFSRTFDLIGVSFCTEISIDEATLKEGLKKNIYRIIQEQINNIVKYAAATKVTLMLKQSANTLTLEIEDNGKGFDQAKSREGIGLSNILYRVEAYNGRMQIETDVGKGCKIKAEFAL